MYAFKPQTGEKGWGAVVAKRGINTGVLVNGKTVIVSHGDENLKSTERGGDRGYRRFFEGRHQNV